MNNENLISFSERSESECFAIRSKGGKAGAEAKKRKKSLSEMAKAIIQCDLMPKQAKEIEKMGLNPDEFNQWTACIFGLLSKASKDGDVKAVEKLQELTGESTGKDNSVIKKLDGVIGNIDVIADE